MGKVSERAISFIKKKKKILKFRGDNDVVSIDLAESSKDVSNIDKKSFS